MKCEKIRDNFEKKYHKKGPTDKAIYDLLMKFQRTGSVHDDSRNGLPRKSGERVELVREAFEEDPQLSTRRASNMLQPYHIQMFHNLQEENYPRRAAL